MVKCNLNQKDLPNLLVNKDTAWEPSWAAPAQVPVVLGDGGQQLAAGAVVEAAHAAHRLLQLRHQVLVLQVDGFSQLNFQEAHNFII